VLVVAPFGRWAMDKIKKGRRKPPDKEE
jgi:hypothetical protein